MTKRVKVLAVTAVVALTLAIGGCGGDDDDTSETDNPVLIPPTTVIP